MDVNTIVSVLKNPKSTEISLVRALAIVRNHIDYCVQHNIHMLSDPLLAKVLLWK